jgi:hypothetical protein
MRGTPREGTRPTKPATVLLKTAWAAWPKGTGGLESAVCRISILHIVVWRLAAYNPLGVPLKAA